MPKVIHFEFVIDNPERAVNFYKTVFDWKIEKWGPQNYWLVTAGLDSEPGINGALRLRKDAMAPVINTISVSSVDDYMKKITQNGGKVKTAKMPIPGVGYFAYCQDTEGNIFGVIQADAQAK
jgi:uncharacterized protein